MLSSAASTTLLPGFVGTTLPEWLAARLRAGLGGVCIFGPNFEDAGQLRRLTDQVRAANPNAVVAIDEEGGDVTRLHYATGSPYPGNAVLGRIDDTAVTSRVAATVAGELRAAGCTLDFAPSVDVNSNPLNPVIGVRSFGADEHLVARHGAAWVTGLQGAGVAACAKHFPGHGDVDADSHIALPVLDLDRDTLLNRELVPFAAAIDAGVTSIMTSHIMLPQIDSENPATMSRAVLEGLLRGDLGFDGLIVSDALDMAGASAEIGIPEAAVRALNAGVDLLCIGTANTDEQLEQIEHAITDAVATGRLAASRVEQAAQRVLDFASATVISDVGSGDAASVDAAAADAVIDDAAVGEAARAIEVSADAAELDAARTPAAVLRLDAAANIAVGSAPWGPFSLDDPWGGAPVTRMDLANDTATDVARALDAASPEGTIIVVGKSNHQHPGAVAVVDALRAAGRPVLTIDMGWPKADRAYADVATFGASRLVGAALVRCLFGPDGRFDHTDRAAS
ncbi:beta-N-acetylhexosaminidase [Microbacterium sp. MPKO10]|uniref:beta-N-acetylhexosaminidase n=1 Tax=Microbacterium sp. MPKO10 TaxID=2989818 RepID=UPI002235D226|nr:beta-N-acetylhexosaminidase [Microbacterium sp. MPKO10]MCW4457651.1 beta-N-acetylhexosaminidase [Microbacterium sp. MPKO10]